MYSSIERDLSVGCKKLKLSMDKFKLFFAQAPSLPSKSDEKLDVRSESAHDKRVVRSIAPSPRERKGRIRKGKC